MFLAIYFYIVAIYALFPHQFSKNCISKDFSIGCVWKTFILNIHNVYDTIYDQFNILQKWNKVEQWIGMMKYNFINDNSVVSMHIQVCRIPRILIRNDFKWKKRWKKTILVYLNIGYVAHYMTLYTNTNAFRLFFLFFNYAILFHTRYFLIKMFSLGILLKKILSVIFKEKSIHKYVVW